MSLFNYKIYYFSLIFRWKSEGQSINPNTGVGEKLFKKNIYSWKLKKNVNHPYFGDLIDNWCIFLFFSNTHVILGGKQGHTTGMARYGHAHTKIF